MSYKRVLPRDLFNEAKLLKCVGKLTLMIEDGLLPDWHYHYDGDPFNIVQDPNDGSISVANISFWCKAKSLNMVHICTPLNSKYNWPAMMRTSEDEEYFIFSEEGKYLL